MNLARLEEYLNNNSDHLRQHMREDVQGSKKYMRVKEPMDVAREPHTVIAAHAQDMLVAYMTQKQEALVSVYCNNTNVRSFASPAFSEVSSSQGYARLQEAIRTGDAYVGSFNSACHTHGTGAIPDEEVPESIQKHLPSARAFIETCNARSYYVALTFSDRDGRCYSVGNPLFFDVFEEPEFERLSNIKAYTIY